MPVTTTQQPVNTPAASNGNLGVKKFFESDAVMSKISSLMGARSTQFVTSVLQVVNGNSYLQKADPNTIYQAAMIAAAMNLPISNTLGQAYIVPYGSQAQFQIGYKGLIQLAHRTGKYEKLNAMPVYENQFVSWDGLFEILEADFKVRGTGKPVGYAFFMKMKNGFNKISFWYTDEVERHGKRYSQSYSNSKSAWSTNFDEMAMKTVIKDTLTTWGELSIEFVNALEADGKVVHNAEDGEFETVETIINQPAEQSEPLKRAITFLNDVENMTQLKNLRGQVAVENFSSAESAEWNRLIVEKEKSLS